MRALLFTSRPFVRRCTPASSFASTNNRDLQILWLGNHDSILAEKLLGATEVVYLKLSHGCRRARQVMSKQVV